MNFSPAEKIPPLWQLGRVRPAFWAQELRQIGRGDLMWKKIDAGLSCYAA
jgi:hypothetical protein